MQIYNANLPRGFQLSVDPVPAAASRAGDAVDTLPPGQILIQYAARADWHGISNPSPTAQGQARLLYLDTAGEIFTTRVWVDPTRHPRGDTLDNGLGVPQVRPRCGPSLPRADQRGRA